MTAKGVLVENEGYFPLGLTLWVWESNVRTGGETRVREVHVRLDTERTIILGYLGFETLHRWLRDLSGRWSYIAEVTGYYTVDEDYAPWSCSAECIDAVLVEVLPRVGDCADRADEREAIFGSGCAEGIWRFRAFADLCQDQDVPLMALAPTVDKWMNQVRGEDLCEAHWLSAWGLFLLGGESNEALAHIRSVASLYAKGSRIPLVSPTATQLLETLILRSLGRSTEAQEVEDEMAETEDGALIARILKYFRSSRSSVTR